MLIGIIAIAILVMVFAGTGIRIVRPFQKGLVERLGKYNRIADSGEW